MKKLLIAALVLIMILSTAACAGQGQTKGTTEPGTTAYAETDPDTPVVGGWSDTQSIEITDEVEAMFDKLNKTLTGAYYEPIVYLSSQVVAGTNHKVLCKMLPSAGNNDAVGTYVIATVYEDLEGKAEVTELLYSGVAAPQPYHPDNPTTGGWSEPKNFEPTEEVKTAVKKAYETADSIPYDPVALLGSQVVAGMNYLVLCRSNPSGAASSEYAILTVYANLQGKAETTDIANFAPEKDGSPADEVSASSQAE